MLLRESLSVHYHCYPHSNLFLLFLGEYLLFNSQNMAIPAAAHHGTLPPTRDRWVSQIRPIIANHSHYGTWLVKGRYTTQAGPESFTRLSWALRSWVYILGDANKMVSVHCLRPCSLLFKEEPLVAKEDDSNLQKNKEAIGNPAVSCSLHSVSYTSILPKNFTFGSNLLQLDFWLSTKSSWQKYSWCLAPSKCLMKIYRKVFILNQSISFFLSLL